MPKKERAYSCKVDWDTDGQVLDFLPETVVITKSDLRKKFGRDYSLDFRRHPEQLYEAITDYLTDKYGFCIQSAEVTVL